MYPLRLVDLTTLDEAFAANEPPRQKSGEVERTSDVRLRSCDDDDESGLRLARKLELDDSSERITLRPTRAAARTTLLPPDAASVDEVLFRFTCGDFEGALAAAEAVMTRVPVVIMPRAELRAEPLGYWHLLLLARVDDETALGDLLVDVPAAEAVRLVCELVERRIIALR